MCISIIIPTCNRCNALARTLNSLATLILRETSEVLIVDNGSTDQTRTIVKEFAQHHSQRIRYLYEPMPGLLSGRHRGALDAKGRVCAFLDDDVRIAPDWLISVIEGFEDPQVALVGGPSTPLYETRAPDWVDGFYTENQHGRFCAWLSLLNGGKEVKEIDPRYVWGLNFAIRRDVLLAIGGFHPDGIPKALQRFRGDGESGLSCKLQRAGFKALYHPRVAVDHEVPAARLTEEYFEQRAYSQGVSDSYARIRADGKVRQASRTWKKAARYIKRFCIDRSGANQTALERVQSRTAKAYQRGYSFHQWEVSRDPKLLDWVLRDNYWDFALPAGWDAFLTK